MTRMRASPFGCARTSHPLFRFPLSAVSPPCVSATSRTPSSPSDSSDANTSLVYNLEQFACMQVGLCHMSLLFQTVCAHRKDVNIFVPTQIGVCEGYLQDFEENVDNLLLLSK